nr:hypothetical protein [Treponema sp.]
ITDMIYQNGCVYILLRDVRTPSYNSSTISEEYPLCSRGAVIKYDTVSKETKTIGWTSNALDSSGKYLYGYSTDGSPLYKNGQILKVSSSDLESAGFSFPNIYSPANSNEGFYGPVKFIAIKPKKLVIADDGLAFYTDENDAYKYKNVNRVVTVDLDTFTLVGNDTSAQFERDYNGYLAASGFSADWSYFGNLTPSADAVTGYQNDVKFVIPCGD